MKRNKNSRGPVELLRDPCRFIGQTVTVCVTSIPLKRDGFHPQMSVEGTLEVRAGEYRVLVSDSTYCYFTPREVSVIVTAEGWETKSGSVAVIYVGIGG